MSCSVHTNYKGGMSIEMVKSDIVDATGCARDVWTRDNLYFGYPNMDNHYQRCYIILDGMSRDGDIDESLCDKIYVPSEAVKNRYNWTKPVTIVPHGVRYLFGPKDTFEIPFMYIAGFAPRKHPPGSEYVVSKLGKNMIVYTTSFNPWYADYTVEKVNLSSPYYPENTKAYTFTRFQLHQLYRKSKFYLSLSGGGAFELTPLEAMASGTPPITLDVKPFNEYNRCGLKFRSTGVIRTPGTDTFLYDPLEVLEIANYAMSMGKEEYYDMSSKCVEIAKQYYYLKVYPSLFKP